MTESEQMHSTLVGLNEWYKFTFEKAGWVVLAINKTSESSYLDKINSYKNGIKRLIRNLNSRLANPQGNNTISRDYPPMIENLVQLLNFIETMNPNIQTASLSDDLAIRDISLYALQNWFKHVFEKFGWMGATGSQQCSIS